jgi:hypothetical protein
VERAKSLPKRLFLLLDSHFLLILLFAAAGNVPEVNRKS